jgi:hypothetical protein
LWATVTWIRLRTSYGLLQTRYCNFWLHKMWGISAVTDRLLVFQDRQ